MTEVCKQKKARQQKAFQPIVPSPLDILLQRSFVPAQCRHPVQIAVADLTLQRGNDLIFSGKKVRACEVGAGDRMVGDEGAVAGQILNKEYQLLQHFLL